MLEKDKVKTAEEFNAELYEKVSAEFEEYKNNLLAMSPEQILEHAYDYAIREDIVLALEYFDLHARQAQALLKADNVLDAVLEKWEGWKNNYMESIHTHANIVTGKAENKFGIALGDMLHVIELSQSLSHTGYL